jgi:hypothetical protein
MTVDSLFENVRKHPDRFYIIHYSSQHLYDEGVDGFSPRITSIVVMHYETRQTVSFALHAEAESLGIPKDIPLRRRCWSAFSPFTGRD